MKPCGLEMASAMDGQEQSAEAADDGIKVVVVILQEPHNLHIFQHCRLGLFGLLSSILLLMHCCCWNNLDLTHSPLTAFGVSCVAVGLGYWPRAMASKNSLPYSESDLTHITGDTGLENLHFPHQTTIKKAPDVYYTCFVPKGPAKCSLAGQQDREQ